MATTLPGEIRPSNMQSSIPCAAATAEIKYSWLHFYAQAAL